MDNSLEGNVINLIDREGLTKSQSLNLIEDLYWVDWNFLKTRYPDHIDKIFSYLSKKNLSEKQISKILRLYNNPYGAYIDEFSKIIINLYKWDKAKFIKSLNFEEEEILNLVYLFRNNFIKIDEDRELFSLIESEILSEEEKETAKRFIKMYENVCST